MLLMSMAADNPDSHNAAYGQSHWMSMTGYAHAGNQQTSTPMYEQQAYDFGPPQPMAVGPAYNMPRPPPYSNSHQLPPLSMPPHNQIWPSMLTSSQPGYPTPILPAAPVQTPVSASTTHASDVTPTSAKSSTARRKLTDDERRKMCIEADLNPGMKQTQIGHKFGVERSTVSKILRQRDKYMNPSPKEESVSPAKKSKTKFPDIERALANWVRNEQKKGQSITDEKLKKQARFFSSTFGSSESQSQLTSSTWIEKFKQKHNITMGYKKGKNVSVDPTEVTIVDSSTTSFSEAQLDDSSESSNGMASPVSPDEEHQRGAAKGDRGDDFFDFDQRETFHDTASMDHVLSHDLDSSPVVISPLSPGLARVAHMAGSTSNADDDQLAYGSNYSRQRSQTFPAHDVENGTQSRPGSSSRHAPLPVRSATSTADTPPLSVNPRETMKRNKSVPDIRDASTVYFSSMQPPPIPKSERASPISPASPSEDEARRALRLIKAFFQERPGTLEPDDWTTIGKLMEKLKLPSSPVDTTRLPGGMYPVDLYDDPSESRQRKKRTILGISA